jgi:hypothetical protein
MIDIYKLDPGQKIYYLGEKDKITEVSFISIQSENKSNPKISLLKINNDTRIIYADHVYATYRECAAEKLRVLENIKRKIQRDLIKITQQILDLEKEISP